MKNEDMPAMPVPDSHWATGLTKHEHACIALRVPETGDAELDALVEAPKEAGVEL